MRRDVIVGTKVRLIPTDHDRIAEAITVSLENSLRRLRREQIDLLQLHNEISSSGRSDALDAVTVVDEMMPVFERLRSRGKIRFGGISCKGDADAMG
jgi:aryl-alcohol dehydrogenase-like predicted oxidoreductase